jgi:hypothetical protein
MDSGPSSHVLEAIHERYGAPGSTIQPSLWTESNAEWDVFYPISALLSTYRFPVQVKETFAWPKMGMNVEELGWENGIRRIKLIMDFVRVYSSLNTDRRRPVWYRLLLLSMPKW